MTQIEIRPIVTVAAYLIGIRAGLPFPALYHQVCIGQIRIAADVVEMQMRIYDIVDTRGIDSARFQPSTQFLACAELHRESLGQRSDSAGIALKIAMQPRIEDHPTLWMFDQIARYREIEASGLFGQDSGGCRFEPSANHRLNSNWHDWSSSFLCAVGRY